LIASGAGDPGPLSLVASLTMRRASRRAAWISAFQPPPARRVMVPLKSLSAISMRRISSRSSCLPLAVGVSAKRPSRPAALTSICGSRATRS